MLGEAIPRALPTRLIVAVDAFGFADADVAAALQPMVERLAGLIGDSREEVDGAARACRSGRARSAPCSRTRPGTTFEDWLDERNPRFAFSVARSLVTGLDDPRERARLGQR